MECSVEKDSEVTLGSVVGTPQPVVFPAESPGGRSGSISVLRHWRSQVVETNVLWFFGPDKVRKQSTAGGCKLRPNPLLLSFPFPSSCPLPFLPRASLLSALPPFPSQSNSGSVTESIIMKITNPRVGLLDYRIWFSHLLRMWPWTGHFSCLVCSLGEQYLLSGAFRFWSHNNSSEDCFSMCDTYTPNDCKFEMSFSGFRQGVK